MYLAACVHIKSITFRFIRFKIIKSPAFLKLYKKVIIIEVLHFGMEKQESHYGLMWLLNFELISLWSN